MTKSLDSNASRVSPPHQSIRGISIRLRDIAGRILPRERVATCGKQPCLNHVELRRKGDRAFFSGVETCGSVWTCPVCAGKIAEARRQEVETVLNGHKAAGGVVYMATLTLRHHKFQTANDLRKAVADTWKRVQSGKRWKKEKNNLGFVGSIRAMEVTYGKNGWHPHIHVLFLIKNDDAAENFGVFMFERWARFVEKYDFGKCDPAAFKFEKAERSEAAGDYVGKWGCDAEITKGQIKKSNVGRSPWQLLEAAGRGNKQAFKLFQEYAAAFKGARQLTWSKNLKNLFGLMDKNDDEIAAAEELAVAVGILPKRVFRQIVKKRLLAKVLDVADCGDFQQVLEFLKINGVNFDEKNGTSPPKGSAFGGFGPGFKKGFGCRSVGNPESGSGLCNFFAERIGQFMPGSFPKG